ncbi:MAG: hypothetical protein MPL62_02495 [Alphaproteobacteria bacterium]|nr:hypothetical protein [Alphaproteobacteria bacterium]
MALVGVNFVLLTIDAQASDTHRWLAALPPKKLKNKKKIIYLIDLLNSQIIFLIFFCGLARTH